MPAQESSVSKTFNLQAMPTRIILLLIVCKAMLLPKPVASQSPEKPTNLKVQRIYTTSVLISWNDVLGFMYKVIAVPNFLMEKNCDNGGTPNATSPFTVTQLADGSRLSSEETFRVGVCAVNGTRSSFPSFSNELRIGPKPPFDILKFSGENNVLIRWKDICAIGGCDDDRTADYYNICLHSFDLTDNCQIMFNSTERQLKVESLNSSTEYRFSIFTSSSIEGGLSINSDRVFFRAITLPSAPIFTQSCKMENNSTALCISWANTKGNIAIKRYLLDWFVTDGSSGQINITGPVDSEVQQVIGGFLPGTAVTVSLRAFNSIGKGSISVSKFYTRPLPPQNISFESTKQEISVKWTLATENIDLVVLESPQNLFEQVTLDFGTTNHTITDLLPGTTYEVEIYAVLQTSTEKVRSDRLIKLVRTSPYLTAIDMYIIIGSSVASSVCLVVLMSAFFFYRRYQRSKESLHTTRAPQFGSSTLHERSRNPSLTHAEEIDARISSAGSENELEPPQSDELSPANVEHIYETVQDPQLLLPEASGYAIVNHINHCNRSPTKVASYYENEDVSSKQSVKYLSMDGLRNPEAKKLGSNPTIGSVVNSEGYLLPMKYKPKWTSHIYVNT